MDSLKAFLSSKRVKAMLAGGIASLIGYLKLDPSVAEPLAQLIMGVVGVYVLGQSYVDGKTYGKTSHSTPDKNA